MKEQGQMARKNPKQLGEADYSPGLTSPNSHGLGGGVYITPEFRKFSAVMDAECTDSLILGISMR